MRAFIVDNELADYADIIRPPEFTRDAGCAEHPEIEFFLEPGGDTRPAKRVCASCLVRAECLEYALANEIKHGIWGGLSPWERRKLEPRRRPRADSAGRRPRVGSPAEIAARNLGVTVDAVNVAAEALYGHTFAAEYARRAAGAATRQAKAGITKRLVHELRTHTDRTANSSRTGTA